MVAAFFTVVILLLFVFLRSMEKDNTLDLFKLEVKLKEEAREQIQAEREQKLQVVTFYIDSIRNMQMRDPALIRQVNNINGQLENNSKKYNEKDKIINTYGSNDLLNYYLNLPKQPDNDY